MPFRASSGDRRMQGCVLTSTNLCRRCSCAVTEGKRRIAEVNDGFLYWDPTPPNAERINCDPKPNLTFAFTTTNQFYVLTLTTHPSLESTSTADWACSAGISTKSVLLWTQSIPCLITDKDFLTM